MIFLAMFLALAAPAHAVLSDPIFKDVCKLAANKQGNLINLDALTQRVRDLPVSKTCYRPDVTAHDYQAFEKVCGGFSLWGLMHYRDAEAFSKKELQTNPALAILGQSACVKKLNPGTRVGITNALSGCFSPRGLESLSWQDLISSVGQDAASYYINVKCNVAATDCEQSVQISRGSMDKVHSMIGGGFTGVSQLTTYDCRTGEKTTLVHAGIGMRH